SSRGPARAGGGVIPTPGGAAGARARPPPPRRAAAPPGLGRVGSHWGHGSGDIALAFSTRLLGATLPDERLEPLFAAAADATEYAVLDALLSAEGVSGFQQHARAALGPLLDRLAAAN
ncbi:P1 family peptidase, partial [Serratia sp. IR-2025]